LIEPERVGVSMRTRPLFALASTSPPGVVSAPAGKSPALAVGNSALPAPVAAASSWLACLSASMRAASCWASMRGFM